MHKKRSKLQSSALQKAMKAKAASDRTDEFSKNTDVWSNSLKEAAKNKGDSCEVLNNYLKIIKRSMKAIYKHVFTVVVWLYS